MKAVGAARSAASAARNPAQPNGSERKAYRLVTRATGEQPYVFKPGLAGASPPVQESFPSQIHYSANGAGKDRSGRVDLREATAQYEWGARRSRMKFVIPPGAPYYAVGIGRDDYL